MEPEVMSKLLTYQREHFIAINDCYSRHDAILEASDTGTGKTAVMCALAAHRGVPIFATSPKSVVPAWFKFARMFNCQLLGVTNYEQIKLGKYFTTEEEFIAGTAKPCPYLQVVRTADGLAPTYACNFPQCLCVFDEAHKGKNYRTMNACVMISIKEHFDAQRVLNPHGTWKIAILSATITDKVKDFKTTLYVLGITQFGKHAYARYIKRLSKQYPGLSVTECIHHALFPEYGARMRVDIIKQSEQLMSVVRENDNTKYTISCDGGAYMRCFHLYMFMKDTREDQGSIVFMDIFMALLQVYDSALTFQPTDIRAEIYEITAEHETAITAAYADINRAIQALKDKQVLEQHALTIILRARQRIELIKVPTFIEACQEDLFNDYAVVIFVNFKETIAALLHELNPFMAEWFPGQQICIVQGGQSASERMYNIDQFQCGKSNLMIVNIEAGGTGTSFHNYHRNAPARSVLISQPWSGITLKQVLGRVDRAGARSPSKQRIVYCRGAVSAVNANDTTFDGVGIEEKMAQQLNKKLQTIELVNNGCDFTDFKLV